MILILLSNEKKYDSIARSMGEYFSDGNQQNQSCLSVRLKRPLAALKRSILELLNVSPFAVQIERFSSQQKRNYFISGA